MTDLATFKTLYIQTAKENIQKVKNGLNVLAQNSTDEKAIEEVFRNSHTLKSKSYVMGQKQIGDLAKSIEDTFYQVKNKTIVLSQEMIATITSQATQTETLLSEIKVDPETS